MYHIESERITLTGLASGTYTLTVVNNMAGNGPNGLPSITSSLTITGDRTAATIIERLTIAPEFRLFHIAPTGTLALDWLTLRDGAGAITNEGISILTNSLFAGNVHGLGSGISNNGIISIANSTLSAGDGISNDGSTTFENSTLVGSGDLSNDGWVTMTNSTVGGSGNISNDGIIALQNSTLASSGDLSNDGWVILQNTIFVMGSGSCDRPLVSLGHNLFFPFDCDIIQHSSDQTKAPGLGASIDDGIPGHGHFPLLPDSPAIARGNDAVCPLMDQLGHTRVGVCDCRGD